MKINLKEHNSFELDIFSEKLVSSKLILIQVKFLKMFETTFLGFVVSLGLFVKNRKAIISIALMVVNENHEIFLK